MAYQLIMKTGPAPGKIYTLGKTEIAIGREAGSEVFVNDVEVSRQHARLMSQFGDYVLGIWVQPMAPMSMGSALPDSAF